MFSFAVLSTVSVLLGILLLFKKFVLGRRKMSLEFPSRVHALFDIYGDLGLMATIKDKPFAFLQIISGFSQLYRDKPLFLLWASYIPFVFFKDPEDVEELIKGTRNLEKSWVYRFGMPWLKTGLLTSTNEKWKSRRKLMSPAFQDNVLKDFVSTINEKAMALVKKLESETSKERFDLLHIINLTSLEILSETIMGVDIHAQENKEDYIRASEKALLNISTRFFDPNCWPSVFLNLPVRDDFKENLKILHKFTMSIIHGNKKRYDNKEIVLEENDEKFNRKPLINLLVEHQMVSKDFTDADIQEELDIFTIAGHDSSSLSLTWTLQLIGIETEIQRRIQKELDQIIGDDPSKPIHYEDLSRMTYLECVIKESLRLFPPVPLIARTADSDLHVRGYTIPKGTDLVFPIYHIHRNERYFPNPEKFDPDRFAPENAAKLHPCAWMPFAAGSRNCIGLRFAMQKIKLVISHILRKYDVVCLDPRDKVMPTIRILLHPTRSIQFRIKLRKPIITTTKGG